MKKNPIQICLFVLVLSLSGLGQTIDPSYEIGTWYDFRNAAVSFTFDDGTPNQFSTAIPLFNKFGMRLTLFTVTGKDFAWPPNWSALQKAADAGHEIASHTITHTSFADLNDSLETVELRDSRSEIEAHITGQKCFTMAYPYCVTGNLAVCGRYYDAARICSGSIEPSTPRNFMAISSIVCGSEGSIKTADHFINKASSAIKSHGWCVYLLHGVDNDGGWSPVTSDVLRETLQRLSENQSDFWVDSFGNVVRYIKERNAASVTELSVQDSSITVQVTDTLQNDIYNFPITIRRQLPQDWTGAIVSQSGESVNSQVVVVEGTLKIQFDAIPDHGDIVIYKSASTLVNRQTGEIGTCSMKQNYPNPFNPETSIEFSVDKPQHVSITVFDSRGQRVKNLLSGNVPAGTHVITWDGTTQAGSHVANGLYFYRITAGDFSRMLKMTLLR